MHYNIVSSLRLIQSTIDKILCRLLSGLSYYSLVSVPVVLVEVDFLLLDSIYLAVHSVVEAQDSSGESFPCDDFKSIDSTD